MARIYDSRKRILVTGGAGFLGPHLVDCLLGQGHAILCVDNLFTGTKRNIEHLRSHPRFEFMRHDVTMMPLPPDDPRRRQPDTTRARTTLGWEPAMALVDGLKPTASYVRSLLS